MAKQHENLKNFLIIEGDASDFLKIGCGFGGGIEEDCANGVHSIQIIGGKRLCCDNCMHEFKPNDTVYFVAVLNRILCPECFTTWYEDAVRYNSDTYIEERNFRNMKIVLLANELFEL